jgi:septum formation protein
MYDSTMQHWLGVQSEVRTLPKALHDLCQALIVCRTDAKKSLLLFTDKRCLELSRPENNGTAQTHFDMIQPILSLLYQLMAPRLLLASRSPRRVQLLRQLMAPNRFEVFPSEVEEEEHSLGEPIEEYLRQSALKKARAVRDRGGFSPYIKVILGADTGVVLDGRVIGQPLGDEEARSMLMQLSGRVHYIMTGIALIDTQTSQEMTDCVTTEVRMRKLTPKELEAYVETQEPIGKAGGYGIQGLGAKLVESIKGSYSNVVGLPLERVIEMLQKDLGLSIWDMDPVNMWQILSG